MSENDTKPDVELFSSGTEIAVPTWNELDATPNDALRELVDKLEDWADDAHKKANNEDDNGYVSVKRGEILAYSHCIGELEAVLEDD